MKISVSMKHHQTRLIFVDLNGIQDDHYGNLGTCSEYHILGLLRSIHNIFSSILSSCNYILLINEYC